MYQFYSIAALITFQYFQYYLWPYFKCKTFNCKKNAQKILRKHQTLQKYLKYYYFDDFLIFRSQIISSNIIYSLAGGLADWSVGPDGVLIQFLVFWWISRSIRDFNQDISFKNFKMQNPPSNISSWLTRHSKAATKIRYSALIIQ